jgi:hypothetical protein
VFADEYPVHARAASGGRWSAMLSWSRFAVAPAAIGISSSLQFLGLIGRLPAGWSRESIV